MGSGSPWIETADQSAVEAGGIPAARNEVRNAAATIEDSHHGAPHRKARRKETRRLEIRSNRRKRNCASKLNQAPLPPFGSAKNVIS